MGGRQTFRLNRYTVNLRQTMLTWLLIAGLLWIGSALIFLHLLKRGVMGFFEKAIEAFAAEAKALFVRLEPQILPLIENAVKAALNSLQPQIAALVEQAVKAAFAPSTPPQ